MENRLGKGVGQNDKARLKLNNPGLKSVYFAHLWCHMRVRKEGIIFLVFLNNKVEK